MKLYEYLGIDHLVNDRELPMAMLLERIPEQDRACMAGVRSVTIKASIERGEHNLHVLEVDLKKPAGLAAISAQIQKVLPHRLLFVFRYDRRFLILWRNFGLTGFDSRVRTDHCSYSTDWIYEEYLNDDLFYYCHAERIQEDRVPYYDTRLAVDRDEDDEMRYFTDIIRNVYEINGCIINSEVISVRYLLDRAEVNGCYRRVYLCDAMRQAACSELGQLLNGTLFLDRSQMSYLFQDMAGYRFANPLGRTGRYPWTYFDGRTVTDAVSEAELTAVYTDAADSMPSGWALEDYNEYDWAC